MMDIADGPAQLLPFLQPLQQLTFLHLALNPCCRQQGCPPLPAYSALTASSKLQHLQLYFSTLPAGVWQHVFPAGRQLPHLRYIDISKVKLPDGAPAPAPAGSLLVSCCPALETLKMLELPSSTEVLALLTGLSMLDSFSTNVSGGDSASWGTMDALCQLTRIRCLVVSSTRDAMLLPLTQLKQLTKLCHSPRWSMRRGTARGFDLVCKVS
jgi:hypothetical protein